VLDAAILPDGSAVGDELKVEVEQMLDGIDRPVVVHGREKAERANVLELLTEREPFEAVIENAPSERGPRRDDRRGDDRGRNRRSTSAARVVVTAVVVTAAGARARRPPHR
jgi:hypothetical protein